MKAPGQQFRKDPLTGRWVIVQQGAPETKFSFEPYVKSSRACPFCPGHEAQTPPAILTYPKKDASKGGSDWQLRVVPNKFPALRIEESPEKTAIGLYDKIGGFGAHEVIIENPDHRLELADLPVEQVELVLRAFRERCLDLRKDARIKYILLFKNYGPAAGASLEHPHSQLIALPVAPSRVMEELNGTVKYHEFSDRCLFCDMLNQEQQEKKLTVLDEESFTALAPFASRFPFETWILPKTHLPAFDSISDAGLAGLARTLKAVLARLKSALGDPPFNFMIHTAPLGAREAENFHWHLEIIPNLTQVAGFELGTGFYVNPTPPEAAAELLRKQP